MKHYMKKGILFRKRHVGIKVVECPYQRDESCGDWCALFHQEENAIKLGCAGVRVQIEDWPEEEKKDKFDPENYHSANPDHPANKHPDVSGSGGPYGL